MRESQAGLRLQNEISLSNAMLERKFERIQFRLRQLWKDASRCLASATEEHLCVPVCSKRHALTQVTEKQLEWQYTNRLNTCAKTQILLSTLTIKRARRHFFQVSIVAWLAAGRLFQKRASRSRPQIITRILRRKDR